MEEKCVHTTHQKGDAHLADFKLPALFVLTLKAHDYVRGQILVADFEAGMSLRLPTNLKTHPWAIGSPLT